MSFSWHKQIDAILLSKVSSSLEFQKQEICTLPIELNILSTKNFCFATHLDEKEGREMYPQLERGGGKSVQIFRGPFQLSLIHRS